MKETGKYLRLFALKIIAIMVLCLLCSLPIFSQTRLVEGTLADRQGNALPGVNIVLKGTTTGTVTDINGNYSIEAPIGSILVFTYIGFLSEEYVVTGTDLVPPGKYHGSIVIPQKVSPQNNNVLAQVENNPGKTFSPYFFIKSNDPGADQMPLKSTKVDVKIAGCIADVTVKQVYENTGTNTIEAIYVFPGSTRAAVYAMTMQIGDRVLVARIKEKKAARMDYEQAKAAGKTASLLEQKRPNVFQMNVANILPGDVIEVELKYTEMLEPVDGIYEFAYPTVVGPRYSETIENDENSSENWISNPYLTEGKLPANTFDININLNTAIPIKKLTCTSHETYMAYSGKESAQIKLSETEKNGGNRDFIVKYGLRGGSVESGIVLHEGGEENFFLLMMEPPAVPLPDHVPPREYVFIVDVSGSMFGFPLDISKQMMENLLRGMRGTDYFNILLFAGASRTYSPGPVPVTPSNIKAGINFINRQQGSGGTRLLDALNNAFAMPLKEGVSRTFVILTDGYVDTEKQSFIMVKENLNKANLFAFGIGQSVNRYMIEGLANAGMGEPFVVTNPNEAAQKAREFREMIENPVFTDINIDFGDMEVYDVDPVSIPDIFAKRPVMVYGKYKGNATGNIQVSGYSGTEKIVKTFKLDEAKRANNEALKYLWARNRVKYIDDYAHYYDPSAPAYNQKPAATADQINEVTQLGLKYNLLTRYTSFVAVDDRVRNISKEHKQVKQPSPLPQGVSNRAVGNTGATYTPAVASNLSGGPAITLIEDRNSLEEVVVIGYGTVKKSDVTACISSVRQEELNHLSSVQGVLQGKAAGVDVISNSGAPGAPYTVKIRGNSSISGNPRPLVVIDGMLLSSGENNSVDPLLGIDPGNIESIEILKDATASSIYGCRGNNGVIIITTKKAQNGVKSLEVNLKKGISVISNKSILDDNAGATGLSAKQPWYRDMLETASTHYANMAYYMTKTKWHLATSLGYNKEEGIVGKTGIEQVNARLNTGKKFKKLSIGGNYLFNMNRIDDLYINFYNPDPNTIARVDKDYLRLHAHNFLKFEIGKGLGLHINYTYDLSGLHHNMDVQPMGSEINTLNYYNEDFIKQSHSVDPVLTFHLDEHPFKINSTLEYRYENTGYNNTWKYNNEKLQVFSYNTDEALLGPGKGNVSIQNEMVLSRTNVNIQDKYLASFSIHADRSGQVADGKTFNWFPSFSLGWRISDENFMRSVSWISELKLRASSGKSGNIDLPVYTYAINNNTNVINPLFLDGDGPRWEITKQHDAGIDAGLFNNRLSISYDIYARNTLNAYLLTGQEMDNQVITLWQNGAGLSAKGQELALNAYIYNSRELHVDLYVNMATNKTKITNLYAQPVNSVLSREINGVKEEIVLNEGGPLGAYYGYKIAGFNEETGEYQYLDLDNNGEIDENDRTLIANTNPKHFGGFGLTIQYYNFSLIPAFKWSYGNDVINAAKIYAGRYSDASAEFPDRLSDYYIEDGSYLRLSDLTLQYNFKENWLSRLKIKQATIALHAYNLFTWTNYSWQDPEFNPWGYGERESVNLSPMIDNGIYPRSKSFMVSIKMKF